MFKSIEYIGYLKKENALYFNLYKIIDDNFVHWSDNCHREAPPPPMLIVILPEILMYHTI